MDLGSVVRTFRASKDMTLNELADLSGMSYSHLSLIENNKRDPSLLTLKKNSQCLGRANDSPLVSPGTGRDHESESRFGVKAISVGNEVDRQGQ